MENNLKTTDLMVGDWVICHHPSMPESFEMVTVSLLHTLEQQEYGHIKEEDPLFRIVKPIPLTTEILEKNNCDCYEDMYAIGYTSYGNYVYYRHGILYFDVYGDIDDDKEICDCLYVHELQRAIKMLEIGNIDKITL